MGSPNVVATCSLILVGLAAARIANRLVPAHQGAHRFIAGGLAFYALLVVPLQIGAALQLGGAVTRLPLWLPAAAGVLALIALRRKPLGQSVSVQTPIAVPREERVAGVAVALLWSACLLNRATGFPASWDGVAYHLPLAVRWLQEGGLLLAPGATWQESLPGNGELVSMLALATGWQALAELWVLPAAIVALAAVQVLAEWLGVDRPAARICSVLAASLPIVVFQAFSAYVDLFGAGLLLGALALGAGLAQRVEKGSEPSSGGVGVCLLAGLGCGLAAGAKPTLWPFAGAAAAVLAFGVSRNGGRGRALALAVGIVAPAAFWFGRAALATGNPFFPLAGRILGITLAPGTATTAITPRDYDLEFVRTRLEWLVYPWVEFKRAGHPFSTGSGLGPAFAAFAPIGAAYALARVRSRRVRGAAAGVAVAALVWGTALRRIPRFGILVVLGLCVLAAPLIQDYRTRAPRVFRALWVTAICASVCLAGWLPLETLGRRVASGRWDRASTYDLPQWLDALPSGSTVINFNPGGEYFNNFALAGRHLGTRVVPYWRAGASIARAPCGAWIVDRSPFLAAADSARLSGLGYRPVTPESPDPMADRWRFWRRERGATDPATAGAPCSSAREDAAPAIR